MKGIWMGPVVGGIIENISYAFLLLVVFDWDKICKDIHAYIVSQSKISNSKTPELQEQLIGMDQEKAHIQ